MFLVVGLKPENQYITLNMFNFKDFGRPSRTIRESSHWFQDAKRNGPNL